MSDTDEPADPHYLGRLVDPDDLRESLEYAEPRIRAALISSFARLMEADPADARRRLSAVNDKTNLVAHLIRDGASNPASYFITAADLVLDFEPPERQDLYRVELRMLKNGATEADLASVHRAIAAGPDALAGREFETYAGAFYHLRCARAAQEAGAEMGIVDPTFGNAEHTMALARHLAEAEDLNNAAALADGRAAGTPGRRPLGAAIAGGAAAAAVAGEVVGANVVGLPPGVGGTVVAALLTPAGAALGRRLPAAAPRSAGTERTAAERAAAALGTALDAAHEASPVPRGPATGYHGRRHRPPGQSPGQSGRGV